MPIVIAICYTVLNLQFELVMHFFLYIGFLFVSQAVLVNWVDVTSIEYNLVMVRKQNACIVLHSINYSY